MPELISIIITSYNAERWIEEAIHSALKQTYPHIEVIVIDDGSQDTSLSIIQSFHDTIIYASQPNQGANVARNHGFRLSKGAYVMFLDGDDWIAPKTIAHMQEATVDHPKHIIACEWRYVQGKNQFEAPNPALKLDPIADELAGRYTATSALLYPRQAVLDVGGWDETLFASQDVDFKLRCLLNGYSMTHIPFGMGFYRLHDQPSISKSSSERTVLSRLNVLKKAEQLLTEKGWLDRYRPELSKAFHRLAATVILSHPTLGAESLSHAERLFGHQSIDGTLSHRILCRVIGLKHKQRLSSLISQARPSRSQGESA